MLDFSRTFRICVPTTRHSLLRPIMFVGYFEQRNDSFTHHILALGCVALTVIFLVGDSSGVFVKIFYTTFAESFFVP